MESREEAIREEVGRKSIFTSRDTYLLIKILDELRKLNGKEIKWVIQDM